MDEQWVYVVTKGTGDKQHIAGIYATLEAAKAANTEGGEWRMDEPDELWINEDYSAKIDRIGVQS